MQRTFPLFGRILGLLAIIVGALGAPATASADRLPQSVALSQERAWQEAVHLVTQGDFAGAASTIKQVTVGGALTEQVQQWLAEYEAKEAARRELDRIDFEKYVKYAKGRIEREEYQRALGWSLAALDSAPDKNAFLQSPWLLDLANDALEAAREHRREAEEAARKAEAEARTDDQPAGHANKDASESKETPEENDETGADADSDGKDDGDDGWRKAWRIYSQLSSLFEREPRYRKLEHEAVTHVRLATMFRKGSSWEERIDKVRWSAAKKALEFVDLYYVEPVDFKPTAEGGFEQLLLLADSTSAQREFEGLANEFDRNDFKLRVQELLDRVRGEPSLDRGTCVKHFRRVREINKQTIRLPEELLVSEMMNGALDPLDDFTTIIWPRASREFDKHTRGNFVGVGISIIKNRADEIEVVTPLEDAPAYRQGIIAGDIIIEVDGKSLKGFTLNKVVDTITGPKGTLVTLVIRRGDKEITYPLRRAKVKIRSVKGLRRDPLDEERWDHWLDRENHIGYLRVTNFQKNTVEDVKNVLSDLPGLGGLVVDLRGNPGGLLDSAWHLTELFLKRGDIVVSTKGRIRTEDHTFKARSNGPYADVPLVILVDEQSASASEIVSGAVRDNKRGTVIGERTFGKFSVQNLIPLGRSQAKLKITTARYYLPNGDSLHREPMSETWGVEPDIAIRLVNKERRILYKLWREANLLGPPKNVEEEKKDGDDDEVADATKDDKKQGAKAADDPDDAKVAGGKKDDEADGKLADAKEPPEPDEPDENNRPKADPQIDAALLWLRVTLLGDAFPTLATADAKPAEISAKP